MLSDLLSQASESKNYVIRETGIDRSTFYQILRGNRVATEDQIERICEYIHPDAETYDKLIDCYEEERVDAKTYQSRQYVKQFFNSLSEEETTGRHTREGQQIAAFLERETAAGAERFRLFLPSISRRKRQERCSGQVSEIQGLVFPSEGENDPVPCIFSGKAHDGVKYRCFSVLYHWRNGDAAHQLQ